LTDTYKIYKKIPLEMMMVFAPPFNPLTTSSSHQNFFDISSEIFLVILQYLFTFINLKLNVFTLIIVQLFQSTSDNSSINDAKQRENDKQVVATNQNKKQKRKKKIRENLDGGNVKKTRKRTE
jgi:Mg2+/Co2+ transporter CorB